ncbi:putative defense protein Hdd11-like [Branchiostoma floridae x Branchiostoma belcheri]
MLAIVLLSLVASSLAFHNGAPQQACRDGVPNHHPAHPQNSAFPFTLSGGAYTPGQPIQLTVSGDRPFRGFQIKASVGTFQNPPAGTHLFQCDRAADTITHSINTDKNSVTVTYLPPAGASGQIGMRLTVAVNHDIYWQPELFYLQQNAAVISG